MKHSARNYQDDLEFLDSINRMSRQLHFRVPDQQQPQHKSQRLMLTIEDLEDEMEAIRMSREAHNHRK